VSQHPENTITKFPPTRYRGKNTKRGNAEDNYFAWPEEGVAVTEVVLGGQKAAKKKKLPVGKDSPHAVR